MQFHFLRGILVLAAVTFAGMSAEADDTGATVYKNGLKSTVKISAPVAKTKEGILLDTGSGSIVNLSQGYILTNWHVVRDAKTDIIVQFPFWEKGKPVVEQNRYRLIDGLVAKVLVSDEKVDLAILKIVQPVKIPRTAVSVRFPADSPLAGTKIHSIGNPAASDAMWVYTPGEVRSVYTKVWRASAAGGGQVSNHDCKIIDATSSTSPGDSGGPCFNEKGEQVGVTQGYLKSAANYSFFVDSSAVKSFLTKNKIRYNVVDPPPEPAESTVATKDKEPSKDKDPDTSEPKKEAPKPKVDTDSEKQEKEAASRLSLLRNYAKDPNKKAFVAEQLQKIIKMYPKTEAAKEAKALLKEIQ
jgi:S1-C subfamily serine protease